MTSDMIESLKPGDKVIFARRADGKEILGSVTRAYAKSEGMLRIKAITGAFEGWIDPSEIVGIVYSKDEAQKGKDSRNDMVVTACWIIALVLLGSSWAGISFPGVLFVTVASIMPSLLIGYAFAQWLIK